MSGIRSVPDGTQTADITPPVEVLHCIRTLQFNSNPTQPLPPNDLKSQQFGPTCDSNLSGMEDVDLGGPTDEITNSELEWEPYSLVRTEVRFFKRYFSCPGVAIDLDGGIQNRRRSIQLVQPRTRLCTWVSF